jgi:uncharacterized coiled-coil protein SlyX
MNHFEQAIDELDAYVFTGDSLCLEKNRQHLKAMCERWSRAIADHEANEDGAADEAMARTGRQS